MIHNQPQPPQFLLPQSHFKKITRKTLWVTFLLTCLQLNLNQILPSLPQHALVSFHMIYDNYLFVFLEYKILSPYTYDDDEKDSAKNARRNRRKFVVNQRGFMGVPSMHTAKLVDEYVFLFSSPIPHPIAPHAPLCMLHCCLHDLTQLHTLL